MTSYEQAHATLNKLEQAGVPCPTTAMSFYAAADDTILAVVRALPEYAWKVDSGNSTWLAGSNGSAPKVTLFVPARDRKTPTESPEAQHARELLTQARS